jgi:hypothetical protein
VKLRYSVDLAKDTIEQLKELSKVSARVGYSTIAWGNRYGAPTALEKKAILDQVDAQLEALKVPKGERKELARPLVRLIGADLFFVYIHTMDRYAQVRDRDHTDAMRSRPEDQTLKAEYQKHINALGAWRAQVEYPHHDLEGYNLKAALRRAVPASWVSDKDAAAAAKFAEEVQGLFDECVKEGGYSTAAAQFLDRYGETKGHNDKLKEVFGRGLD